MEIDGREGCFMVRDSSRPGVFTLTLLVKASGLVLLLLLLLLLLLVIRDNSYLADTVTPSTALISRS